ncbi:hypothetical protein [Lentzea sp. NBRC 102530]|uniref:hypothetical protein n=1 Tax=Lentzea sp. NBRC 102530 TaxID=3032201 RepID=UPI0024A154BB|nr:hypothetical protein [Lentzea sp. NBRC 102530]GLY48385.1 hypothetical protein Lesp01_20410 [Lentzea sp. NBRC 102530]
MSSAGELTNLFERGFQGLEDKARECGDRFNAGVDHINDWRFVLGPAMLVINPALDAIGEAMQKLFKLIRTAVEHHTPVVSLILQSFNWVENVQQPMNGLSHVPGDTYLAARWSGEAAAVYSQKLSAQNDAMNAISTKADGVSKWLMDIAKYNVEYMTELSKMATEFLGALVTAAIEGATVVGIVFSVKDLAGAIGNLVTQSLNNLVGIAKRFVEALSKVRDLLSMTTDKALPNQGWPQAVKG